MMHEWEGPLWLTWLIGRATPLHVMNGWSYHGTSDSHSASVGPSTDASSGWASHTGMQLASQMIMNSSKSLSVNLSKQLNQL